MNSAATICPIKNKLGYGVIASNWPGEIVESWATSEASQGSKDPAEAEASKYD